LVSHKKADKSKEALHGLAPQEKSSEQTSIFDRGDKNVKKQKY